MKADVLEVQRDLSELVGCPGREGPVREYLQKRLEGYADELYSDGAGNLVAKLYASGGAGSAGREESRTVLLTAHMDEVGFMVSHVEETGFLRVAPLGSIDPLLLSGTPLQFLTSRGTLLRAVFTSVPPHVRKKGESVAVPGIDELAVDLGFSSGEEVREGGLDVGSVGTFLSPFRQIEGGSIMGKAFDDRSGCNIALQTLLRFRADRERGEGAANSLTCLFTTAEEYNHIGARSAALSQEADVVFALENTTTTDTPGVPAAQVITRLGEGPALTIADKSYIVPQELLDFIRGVARKYEIPWQYKKPVYGGTDAGSLAVLKGGTPAALVSVPCRYLHAPAGLSRVADLERSMELVYRLSRDFTQDAFS